MFTCVHRSKRFGHDSLADCGGFSDLVTAYRGALVSSFMHFVRREALEIARDETAPVTSI